MSPANELTPTFENLPDRVFEAVCEGKRHNDGNAPTLFHLALKFACSEGDVDTALRMLTKRGKISYTAHPYAIVVVGGRWLPPGTPDPAVLRAVMLPGSEPYTPPTTLEAAQRDCRLFRAAARMHLLECDRLRRLPTRASAGPVADCDTADNGP